jgi:hypothetical protein
MRVCVCVLFPGACMGARERGWADAGVRAGCADVGERDITSRTCALIPQGGNNLGPQGAGHLARALEKMTGMQMLDLVSHVGVRMRAFVGRLRAFELGCRQPGRGAVCWGKGAWMHLGVLEGG